MATQITSGSSTITPTVVLGYEAKREAQSIVHPILGKAAPDVTLRPAALRSGTLTLGFWSNAETASKSAADLLSTAATFNLVSTDLSTIPMSFAVSGDVVRTLDEDSLSGWTVAFDYVEIT